MNLYLSLQMSHKNKLILVITKLGQLFVYNLEKATEVYQDKFSQLPILLTIEASSLGGFYAIDEQGKVFLATINQKKILRTYFGRQVYIFAIVTIFSIIYIYIFAIVPIFSIIYIYYTSSMLCLIRYVNCHQALQRKTFQIILLI